MRRVVAFVRAILLGTILSSVCVNAAAADFEIDDEKTVLFFSGRDIWYHGAFTHGGLLWSPRGLDRPGFTLKLLLGAGIYRYVSGALGDIVYIGPELGGFAHGDNYNQVRLGLHLTDVKVDDLECSVAFGWAFDNSDRSSLYGRVAVHLRK